MITCNPIRHVSLAMILIVGWVLHGMAQVDRARVVVAYLNNFALYTTWPEEALTDTFRIAVMTTENELVSELNHFSRLRKIKGLPVAIQVFSATPDRISAHIFLLTASYSGYLGHVNDLIADHPILLVSEGYPDRRGVMINLYETAEHELLFEVNEANIMNQNLAIDPEILLAGGSTLDLARLYRQSQQDMRAMKAEIDQIADSLGWLQKEIASKMDEIDILGSELESQKEMLDRRSEEIDGLEEVIMSQRSMLENQQDSIMAKSQVLTEQEERLKQQVADYLAQEQELLQLEQLLEERQMLTDQLDREIAKQDKILGQQSEVISRQRTVMMLLAAIGLLTLVLIISIYLGYRRNRAKNRLLSEQKIQIMEKLQQLEELNIKLQDADHYKSVFLASMSHELRTPLNSIIGYTGILLMGLAGDMNKEQKNQLTKVKNNGSHLLSLINDVLDISKIEADRVDLYPESFDLKGLVHEIIDTLLPRANEKNLDLGSSVPDNLVLYTDKRRLKQVILNLMSNAVNYSEAGSIEIIAHKPDGADTICLSVKDTGIGIPKESLGRLFQPFHQIESNLTKKNKGTGLGLYLCKKLMKLMQGDIYVESEPGKGSTFTIDMPININMTVNEASADH